jgi:hypothetical protein
MLVYRVEAIVSEIVYFPQKNGHGNLGEVQPAAAGDFYLERTAVHFGLRQHEMAGRSKVCLDWFGLPR